VLFWIFLLKLPLFNSLSEMSNEIEEISDLFDEFFIIDSPQLTPSSATSRKTAPGFPDPETLQEKQLPESMEPEVLQPEAFSLPPLIFSGANKRLIAVIYNDKNNDSRENVEMLSNLITKALKMSMDDVAIIRLSKNPGYPLPVIFNELRTEKAMVWGATDLPGIENLQTEVHQQVQIGKTIVLINDEVYKYHNNAVHKARLWEAIQKLFNGPDER
jgi:hypothetical protein